MEGLTDVDSQVSYWIRRLGNVETELSAVRATCIAAGVSDHEGGHGDSCYVKPTPYMVEELAAWKTSAEDESEFYYERQERAIGLLHRWRASLRRYRRVTVAASRWAAAELALQAANEAASADFQADLMASQGAIDAKHKPTVWQMKKEHAEATAALLEAVKETQK